MSQSLPTPAAPRPTPADGALAAAGRREARLRPEFAGRYPGVNAGVWEPAAVLCDRVLASRLLRGSAREWSERVLPPEHFEFRGGDGLRGERPLREDR